MKKFERTDQMKQNKRGRPSVFTEKTLQKLERAFSYGLSDREACLYAGIAPSSLYKYCNDNADFSELKELLKDKPKMRAKIVVAQRLNKGDVNLAKWYLETRASDEFGTKTTTEITGGQTVFAAFEKMSDEELRKMIQDADG